MPKKIDHWSWSEMSYQDWRSAVDERLWDIYLINIEYAGLDDDYLTVHWEIKQSPYEFVEWYALKHDLDPKSAIGL